MNRTPLPHSFWGNALETAARIVNMVPTKKVNKTPYELWFGKVPNMSYLRIWGCNAYVKRETSNNLEPRSIRCIFVGYPKETASYYFFQKEENRVFIARKAEFLEKDFILNKTSGSPIDLEEFKDTENTEPSTEIGNVTELEPVIDTQPTAPIVRRSSRVPQVPDRWGFVVPEEEVFLMDLGEPANYKAATSDSESDKWLEAMRAEIQSMYDNQVWDLVDLPPQTKPVGCKWIFKKKIDMDGNVQTYKARLVAKGFTQIQGVDYDETFSPVAKIKSIRTIMAIAAYYDYEIWQMDVKTAFLNGLLTEDVYMEQSEGFVDSKDKGKMCKLRKSIYGLKQASRTWYHQFDENIKKFGFSQSPDEPCVYIKVSGSKIIFLTLYIDDILIIGNEILTLEDTKAYLSKSFQMKDLGEAT